MLLKIAYRLAEVRPEIEKIEHFLSLYNAKPRIPEMTR